MRDSNGWAVQRPRTLLEVRELIAFKRAELKELELEEFNLIQGARLEAIVQIRNIMRAQQLTVADIVKC